MYNAEPTSKTLDRFESHDGALFPLHPRTSYSSLHETSHHVTTQRTRPHIAILYLFQLLNNYVYTRPKKSEIWADKSKLPFREYHPNNRNKVIEHHPNNRSKVVEHHPKNQNKVVKHLPNNQNKVIKIPSKQSEQSCRHHPNNENIVAKIQYDQHNLKWRISQKRFVWDQKYVKF